MDRQPLYRAVIAALVTLTLASPAYGNGLADALGRIFLRAAIDVAVSGARVPPAAPVPVPVPVSEVIIQGDPSVRLKDQDLDYVPPVRQPPFWVRDFKRSFYTVVGGDALDATGLVQQDGLPDPAVDVSIQLDQAISRHYGTHDLGPAPAPATAAPPPTAPGAPLGAGFTLQVTTTYWEMKAVSDNPVHLVYGLSHYGIYYDAKFRLVDRRDGSILAEGKCDVAPSTWGAPTYEEAVADGGKRLKEMLQATADQCALDMEADYLSIKLPATGE